MLSSTTLVSLLVSISSLVSAEMQIVRRSRHSAASRIIKREPQTALVDPANLSNGSYTIADGCTSFYNVPEGSFFSITAENNGITLEDFYLLNPQIDDACSNLWAKYSYCVAGVITTYEPTSQSTSSALPLSTSRPIATPVATPVSANLVVLTPVSSATPVPSPSPTSIDSPPVVLDPTSSSSIVDSAPSATDETSASVTPAPAPSTDSASALVGITAFQGVNSGAIASWFETDLASDSTNGHSWCGFPYTSNTPGFAPDVTTMLNEFGGDRDAAGAHFCGLEATFTTPDGRTATLVLADGFDSKWVRTPASIDVVHSSFPLLFGSQTNNKNDVVQNVSWQFTGVRNPRYVYNGQGN